METRATSGRVALRLVSVLVGILAGRDPQILELLESVLRSELKNATDDEAAEIEFALAIIPLPSS